MINFEWYNFFDLSLEQLYSFLKLRSDVFVVEQQCVYSDIDGKDMHAIHLLGYEDKKIVGYLRLFPPTLSNPFVVFGRVVTHPDVRKKGYGKLMMAELSKYCDHYYPETIIKCSAQLYLKKFYESFNFKAIGDVYDEDGIPHISMKKEI